MLKMQFKRIDEYHQHRLRKYMKIAKLKNMHSVIQELVKRHRQGENIAKHISAAIGEDHDKYMVILRRLGEHTTNIQ